MRNACAVKHKSVIAGGSPFHPAHPDPPAVCADGSAPFERNVAFARACRRYRAHVRTYIFKHRIIHAAASHGKGIVLCG